jgi:hypothetical protein
MQKDKGECQPSIRISTKQNHAKIKIKTKKKCYDSFVLQNIELTSGLQLHLFPAEKKQRNKQPRRKYNRGIQKIGQKILLLNANT